MGNRIKNRDTTGKSRHTRLIGLCVISVILLLAMITGVYFFFERDNSSDVQQAIDEFTDTSIIVDNTNNRDGKPPTQEEIESSTEARETRASMYINEGNTQAAIDMYSQLITKTSDQNQKAQLLQERALALYSSDVFKANKDIALADAIEADRILESLVSARLVEDIAHDAGDEVITAQYAALAEERTDKNVQVE